MPVQADSPLPMLRDTDDSVVSIAAALGYQLEEILHLPPETIAKAGEGDETAMRACDEQRFKDGKRTSSEQRPSMGQDMEMAKAEFGAMRWRR